MIRFKIRELMSEKAFQEGKRLTFEEVSQATGINRTTLSKMASPRGHNTTTDNLDRLCEYFGCSVCDVAEHVKMSDE